MLPIVARGALGAAALLAVLLAVTGSPLAQTSDAARAPAPPAHQTAAQPSESAGAVYRLGPLVVEAPWSRATPNAARVAAGYLRITNTGTTPDRLVGGSFAASDRFEVHEMSMADGVMRMRPLEHGLEIRPGQTVELKPGGTHAMLLDLKHPLKDGETVSGTLRFEKAGSLEITYAVRSMGAQAAGGEPVHR